MLVALVSLFSVGCGSSSEDFVFTGNNNAAPAPTGNLTFQFQRAQAATVPLATETLEFEFFDTGGNAVDFVATAYNNTVTVVDVPVSAVEVRITAYAAGGVPLATVENAVVVVGGANSNVDLTAAVVTPVTLETLVATPTLVALAMDGPTTVELAFSGTFSNGDVVAFNATTGGGLTAATTADPAVATVDVSGVVTAVAPGATSADLTFSIHGTSASITGLPITVAPPAIPLGTLSVEPESLVIDNGGLLGALTAITSQNANSVAFFRAYYTPPGSMERIEVTPSVGVSFGNFFPQTVTASSFTYLSLLGEGIAVTANPLGPTPPMGATATMTVTYISEGQVYTDDVQITLGTPSFDRVTVAPGDLTLPLEVTGFPVMAYAHYTNGLALPIEFGTPNLFGDTFTLEAEANTSGVAAAGQTVVVTAGVAGGEPVAVNILRNAETDPSASFSVSLIDAEVADVVLAPAEITLAPFGAYTVTVVFDDVEATTLDVTPVWFPDIVEGTPGDFQVGGFSGFQGGRMVGTEAGTAQLLLDDTDVTAALNNNLGLPGVNGDTSNDLAEVTILSVLAGLFAI